MNLFQLPMDRICRNFLGVLHDDRHCFFFSALQNETFKLKLTTNTESCALFLNSKGCLDQHQRYFFALFVTSSTAQLKFRCITKHI